MVNHVGETCDKCKQNCLLIHGKNITSPPIKSFFKIMIGENFSKFMCLPPKFGPTVSNLVGQNVNLEGTNGHQWVITVEKVDNSIAFKQGWPAFSSDHGLNFGDFVIFHYLSETNFVVHVYDKSGCKKTDFPKKGYPNKRPRTDESYISKDAPKCHTSDKSSMNKQDSNTSATKSDIEMNQNHSKTSNLHNFVDTPTKYPSYCATSSGRSLPVLKPDSIEESYIMINRDLGCKQEEDRRTLMFDLSNFEMQGNIVIVNQCSVRSSPKQSDFLTESETLECTIGQDPVAVREIIPVKDSCNTKTTKTTYVLKPCGNKEDGPDMVTKRCQFAKPSVNISNEPRDNQVSASKMHWTSSRGASPNVIPEDKMTMGIKQEKMGVTQKFVDLTQEHQSHEEMIQGISGKESLKFMKGSQSQSSAPIINEVKVVSCLVSTNNKSFLELPSSLPKFKGKKVANGNTVCLQDNLMRQFYVIYHERYNLKFLTSGWEAFSKAHSIQQGDECVFELENWEDAIFNVRIKRRF